MGTPKEDFEQMVKTVQSHYPKYKVIAKETSRFHKFIGWILKTFTPNKEYMTRYWTTIGATVAYPIEETPGEHYNNVTVNVHEGNHAGQCKRWTSFLMGSLYLLGTPVYAVLFLLLSVPFFIVGGLTSAFPWWVGFIVLGAGLVLSCPVPFGYWRYRWEAQAYGVSLAVRYWVNGKNPDSVNDAYIDNACLQFTTGAYFYMMPFKSVVKKRLQKARELVTTGKFFTQWDPYYADYYASCYNTLKNQGRIQ